MASLLLTADALPCARRHGLGHSHPKTMLLRPTYVPDVARGIST